MNEPSEVVSTSEPIATATASDQRSRSMRTWALWLMINAIVAAYFLYGLFAPASSIKSAWLPGETTHGHYQIELDCNACHLPAESNDSHSSENVMQNACIRCHGEQLKEAKDTHPAKKFNDPTNADRLAVLNAQDCLTCHREHVPDRTLAMGLTVPQDYCWHCHQDVADVRPSHQGMAYDSCATAGCHNYHDNRALNERFLHAHEVEDDFFEAAFVLARKETVAGEKSLSAAAADHPREVDVSEQSITDWAETAHATSGVNCSGCHQIDEDGKASENWSNVVSMAVCRQCHTRESDSFLTGKHGMRLAAGMSPMTPDQARLEMHAGAAHAELTCNACHSGHRFDTQFAAAEACKRCHADAHTLAYESSSHAELWRNEVAGIGEPNSGVSCATCHLPRLQDGKEVWVNHDQNSNLRPNETMAMQVCNRCHGIEYSLSALADPSLKDSCYSEPPATVTESVDMVQRWFAEQEAKRQRRKKK